ncbi:hypothetical protein HYH03_005742 [Edaphochlamys debaryana]|uniref:BACK domain-containing protein n=1 Tax=Edaphochlamys debaryana TaxID=47281 RepID=A0A835Y4U8_9CHLO|nr:hypothetical protein HYH03_005742 [Edaphochlamys debaryana]|eukprot:KAG2496140.1 hypothetical protein HYH03_005742 [Edaphochlamys debaryana]
MPGSHANAHLVAALADLFGQETKSDCSIQFYLEAPAPDGDPPERFGTQLDRWVESSPGDRPVLRVPLGSEAELPAAHLAIRFAYTGQIHASSVREALEVLRAGDYLAIEGCAAACSQWLADKVQEAPVANVGPPQPQAAASEPPLLQLLACEDLWPSSDARFQAVLSAAKAHLVRHFVSTLAALNRPSLRQQLEALLAAALEALLESNDLATDSEDSVLLMLATWMRANWAHTDAADRKRLCDLIRLAQLSPSVTSCVLLSLAADFESKGPEHEAGWFPIPHSKAALVSCYHACSPELQADMREGRTPIGTPAWLKAGKRAGYNLMWGTEFPWSISRAVLRAALEQLAEAGEAEQGVHLGLKVPAILYNGEPCLMAGGYAWTVGVIAERGKPNASVYLECRAPEAFKVPGSSLAGRTEVFPASFCGHLAVYRWRDGQQEAAVSERIEPHHPVYVGAARRLSQTLPLVDAPAVLAAADPLAAWEPYLGPNGKITGVLTHMDPVMESLAAAVGPERALRAMPAQAAAMLAGPRAARLQVGQAVNAPGGPGAVAGGRGGGRGAFAAAMRAQLGAQLMPPPPGN